jgi:S1-C subfamily serine protease
MAHNSSSTHRAILIAAALMAMTATLGFSQNAAKDTSNATLGHPSEPGALVVSVEPGSPAQKTGIARGDIILDVNGITVDTQADVRKAVVSHKEGDVISMKVRHGDAEKTISVTLGAKDGRAYMGVLLLPDGQERIGMRNSSNKDQSLLSSQGAFVALVASGSPADKAGLKKGDMILSVDGTLLDAEHNLSSLIQQKKSGDTVTLSVQSDWPQADKSARNVKVTLGSSPDKKGAWLGVSYREGFPIASSDEAGGGFVSPGQSSIATPNG